MPASTIQFIDNSNPQSASLTSTLTLSEAADLVKARTGRTLTFAGRDGELPDFSNFALMLLPAPLGFVIIAAKNIPAGTLLFNYGGELEEPAKMDAHRDIEYRMTSTLPGGREITYEAKDGGGLGSLLPHLPNQQDLAASGLSEVAARIQTENVSNMLNGKDIYMIAARAIPAGSLIGFSYSLTYWMQRGISPAYFRAGSTEILPNAELPLEPVMHLVDSATGHELPCDVKRKEAVVAGLTLTSLFEIAKENTRGTSPWFDVNTHVKQVLSTEVHVADLLQAKAEAARAQQQGNAQVIVRLPVKTPFSGCMPPPGYTFDEKGRTKLRG